MASHYRAGEITFKNVSGRTYQITATTYTDPRSGADPNTASITLSYGDKNSETVQRTTTYISPNDPSIRKNTYVTTHTYSSDGLFTISLADPNRVGGIININGGASDQTPFYVESLLRIDIGLGINNSIILQVPPIDRGCGGFLYVHNPGAYDPDRDRLHYELIAAHQSTGVEVPNYAIPNFTHSLSINDSTGELIWNTPYPVTSINPHLFVIAIKISEYRRINGIDILVGYVVRDMQIIIEACNDSPPVIGAMPNVCKQAGDIVQFSVSASDPNTSQNVSILGYGAPFDPSIVSFPATLSPANPTGNPVSALFTWRTNCNNISYEPYQAIIKATDDYSTPLSDIRLSRITVIGPAPINMKVKQIGNGFKISWNQDVCHLASNYKIYKRVDSSHWVPPTCFRGVDESLFTLIGNINTNYNYSDTSFYDDGNGNGLSPLVSYCYRIVAVYPPRAANGTIIVSTTSDSYASAEVCGIIIRSKPIITNVSIRNTSNINGSLILKWLKPDTLDTVQYAPPYQLIFKRATSYKGPFTAFDSMNYSSFKAITDSSLIDTNLNTLQTQYYYKIDFTSLASGNNQFIDYSPIASSVKANIYSSDKSNILSWSYAVPWNNSSFVIYRKNNLGIYDSIGFTMNDYFVDSGLKNKDTFYYAIKTIGYYSQSLLSKRLENFSQQIYGIPIDTIRPCAPILTLTPPCNSFNDFTNVLNWTPIPGCASDVVYYKIYYKRLSKDEYQLLETINNNTTFQYNDTSAHLKQSIAGCYVVVGVDSSGNESFFTNETCTDNCPQYSIPNVFTPQGDSHNDLLNPFPYRFVDRIDMTIYNRWGADVYQTFDLDINWDGKDQKSKVECSDGVYFYICNVYEIYLAGIKKRTIKGTIQILR